MTKETGITESEDAMDVDQLLEEFDLDTSKLRKPTGNIGKFIALIAILFSTFQFYTAGFGTLLSAKQRSLHVIFAFVLGFLLFPATKKSSKTKPSILDFIFSGLTVVVFGYLFVFVEEIANKGGNANTLDMILGIGAILITLEVTRRAVGPELPIVAIVFLAYAKLGPYMPGILGHRGYTFERIVSHMYLTLEGIMGIPLGVSATFVFMFIFLDGLASGWPLPAPDVPASLSGYSAADKAALRGRYGPANLRH